MADNTKDFEDKQLQGLSKGNSTEFLAKTAKIEDELSMANDQQTQVPYKIDVDDAAVISAVEGVHDDGKPAWESVYQPLISNSPLPTPQKPPRSTSTLLRMNSAKSAAAAAATAPGGRAHSPTAPKFTGGTGDEATPNEKDLMAPNVYFTGAANGTHGHTSKRLSMLSFFKNRWVLIGVLSILFLILVLVIIGISVTRKPRPPPVKHEIKVSTSCGFVIGSQQDGAYVFKGIPYTARMTNARRWSYPPTAPQLEDCFNSSYPALEFKGPCYQASQYGADPKKTVGTEDCLYMNVWTPSILSASARTGNGQASLRPVLVYIHGGFLSYGSGHMEPTVPSSKLANALDAVVVSFNYRLNVFGFLALESLENEKSAFKSGNYGIWDQIVALTWIKDNIREFGGNPDMVTVAGLDGGATSIYALLASPYATGLFQRVWLSGGSVQYSASLTAAYTANLKSSIVNGCTRECLHNLATTDIWAGIPYLAQPDWLLANSMGMPVKGVVAADYPMAIIDGKIIPIAPMKALASKNIPMLLGTNSHETDYSGGPPQSNKWLCLFMGTLMQSWGVSSSSIDQLSALYPCNETASKHASLDQYLQMTSDVRSTCPYNHLASVAAQGWHRSSSDNTSSNVYRYVSLVAPPVPSDLFGIGHENAFATHGFDVIAFFGSSFDISVNVYKEYQSMVRSIVKAFVHNEDLGALNVLPFPAANLLTNHGVHSQPRSYHEDQCQFWDSAGFSPYARAH